MPLKLIEIFAAPGHMAKMADIAQGGYDGVERVSTPDLFDCLDVPQRARTAGACRRLAKLMRELRWTPVKARGITQSGFRDQVRGYDIRGISEPLGRATLIHHHTMQTATQLSNSRRLIARALIVAYECVEGVMA
jgi:hypothetical protein